MITSLKGRFSLLFLALAMLLAVPVVALADNLKNDLQNTVGVGQVRDYTAGATATSVGYYIEPNNKEFAGCDAADGSVATVSLSVSAFPNGSSAGAVTISPQSRVFSACDVKQQFEFSTAANAKPGDYTIAADVSDARGSYNESPATFVLRVSAPAGGGGGGGGEQPAANRAPVVATSAADALGTEGDTLSTSGAFSDPDGHSLSLSVPANTPGTFVDNGNGTWSWSLSTNDDVALSTITVTANDGNGGDVTDSFDYRALNADPDIQNLSLNTGANNTACLNGKSVGLSFGITDPGTADTHSGTIDWGDGTSEPFVGSSANVSHSYVGAGSFNITVTANDDDGGSDTDSSLSGSNGVNLTYNMSSGLLSPVNADGSSVFKLGSTIPMKVKITDCKAIAVSGLSPSIKFSKFADGTYSGVNESTSTSAADTSNVMRYSDGQYIYNLASKSLGDGSYKAVIGEANSTPSPMTSQPFGIRK